MPMLTKYIVIKSGEDELIFTFPYCISHDKMFETICHVRQGLNARWTKPLIHATAISAGFVSNDGICHGKSESLKLSSRPGTDTMLLNIGQFK